MGAAPPQEEKAPWPSGKRGVAPKTASEAPAWLDREGGTTPNASLWGAATLPFHQMVGTPSKVQGPHDSGKNRQSQTPIKRALLGQAPLKGDQAEAWKVQCVVGAPADSDPLFRSPAILQPHVHVQAPRPPPDTHCSSLRLCRLCPFCCCSPQTLSSIWAEVLLAPDSRKLV